jgi:hypothetical protein
MFQLSPKEFFTFFVIGEPDTVHLGELAHKLAHAFSASVQPTCYGQGVKSITATLVLSDPEGLGKLHKLKRPRYTAGRQTIKAHGIVVSTEDTLEFGLRPTFDGVRNARSESQLACAIVPALTQAGPNLRALKVPDFDIDRFLSDLIAFFERAGQQGVYTH